MAIRDRQRLHQSARDALEQAGGSAKRLVLIHGAAAALLCVTVAVLDFILQNRISGTSGLDGLGMRSILQTLQQVLSIAVMAAPLFWNMGYTYSALKMSRGEQVRDLDLLQGFRNFGPVLRLAVLESLITVAVCVCVTFLGSSVLSATPLATPYFRVMAQLAPKDGSQLDLSTLDTESLTLLAQSMQPILIGCVALSALAMIPVLYRLRLSKYYLMDEPKLGALYALLSSSTYTRRRCLQLLRLDLSFWWYYAAQLLISAIAYGDKLLPLLNISLPFSESVAYLLFYSAGLVCQVGLFYIAKNRVELTYVQAYEAMRGEPAPTPVPKPVSSNPPWNTPPM